MKEFSVEGLTKTYGIKNLLDNVNLSIRTGDRIGLIGPNGTGKSSFLKVIVGLDNYDSGEIIKPNDYTIAYLEQNPKLSDNKTILETVYDSPAKIVQLVLSYEEAVRKLEEDPTNDQKQDQFNKITEQMNINQAWDVETRAKTILSRLGINNLDRLVKTCSGGEKKRIGLAQVLISDSDLLILDEPTNHLDIESIRWVEEYLSNYKGALLVVTHDRYFLDNVVNRIVELRHGNLTFYQGNYEAYLAQRLEKEAHQSQMEAKQDRLYKQELQWMRKSPRARGTKQKARMERFDDLTDSIQARHNQDQDLKMDFDQQRIGNQIIELEDFCLSIAGKRVIDGWTKHFVKGDRLGVVGPNGVGKSTLLNAIHGDIQPDSGSIIIGETVRMAYYKQMDDDLPDELTVIKYIQQVAEDFKLPDGRKVNAAQLLERFNFSRLMQSSKIGQLSGGEKRRLYLLSLLAQQPNVILLDEPTNNLDIDTMTVLEDYLMEFKGVVITVSHDRYFLDRICNQILAIEGGGNFTHIYGGYWDWQVILDQKNAQKRAEIQAQKTKDQKVKKSPQKTDVKKMTFKEQKEWETIEADTQELESLIDELNEKMQVAGAENNVTDLIQIQKELDESELQLLHLYERYEYLSKLKP